MLYHMSALLSVLPSDALSGRAAGMTPQECLLTHSDTILVINCEEGFYLRGC